MFKFSHHEHCIEEGSVFLGEGKRSAPFESQDWNSSNETAEVAGIADDLEGGGRFEVGMEGRRIVPNFCFFCGASSTVDEKK